MTKNVSVSNVAIVSVTNEDIGNQAPRVIVEVDNKYRFWLHRFGTEIDGFSHVTIDKVRAPVLRSDRVVAIYDALYLGGRKRELDPESIYYYKTHVDDAVLFDSDGWNEENVKKWIVYVLVTGVAGIEEYNRNRPASEGERR